jgi:hypothetical protein
VELHAHTDQDPLDRIAHTARELIDCAATLGYHGLAITCHDRYFDPAPDETYARDRGIVLISGIERTIGGRHVLLINFPQECAHVRTFADIARLKSEHPRGLVIAPHPFYPTPSALGREMDRHPQLFDAVEISAFYTRQIDFNARARAWAEAHGLPLVGNADAHALSELGTTYTLVDAQPDPDAICAAIRAGRTEVHTRPLALWQVAYLFPWKVWIGLASRIARLAGRRSQGRRRS